MAANLISSLVNGVVQATSDMVGNVQTHEANKISKEANKISAKANEIAMMTSKPTLCFTGKLLWLDKDAVELYNGKTADMAHAMDENREMSELDDVVVLTVQVRNLGKEEINKVVFEQFVIWQGTLKEVDGSQEDLSNSLILHAEDAALVHINIKPGEEKDINVILPLDKYGDDEDEMRNSVENDSVALYATFKIFTVSGGSYGQKDVPAEYWRGDLQE